MSTHHDTYPSHCAQSGRPVAALMNQAVVRRSRSRLAGEPARGLVITVMVLLGYYLLVQAIDSAWLIDLANTTGPLALGLIAFFTGFRLVRRQPLAIWTPYAWFLGGILLFYSLGPLAYTLGSESVRAYLDNSLSILLTPADLLRTNLLNIVGIFSILVGLRLARSVWAGPMTNRSRERGNLKRIKTLASLLLILGGALQYLLILPWEFGIYDFILPGMIYNLAKLFLFGLFALAYVVARGERSWSILLYVLWILQVLVSLLHFSKTDLMLSLLLPVLGFYLANKSIKRLLGAGLIMGLAYVSVAQLIHYGRVEIVSQTGTINQATLGQRLNIIGRWINGEAQIYQFAQSDLSASETGWTRLSYANVQTFAMDRFDAGMPGETLKTALIVLIPRVLWPGKPATTTMGKDFYELVQGIRSETHLGLGLFGEGYWNLGWLGVILLGVATGVVFWILSVFAIHWMRIGAFEYMPSIFLGINMGVLGTSQLFANAIVGGAGFSLFYALFVSRFLGMVVGRSR